MREAAVVELLMQKMRAAQMQRDSKINDLDAWYDFYDGQAEAYADCVQLLRKLNVQSDGELS